MPENIAKLYAIFYFYEYGDEMLQYTQLIEIHQKVNYVFKGTKNTFLDKYIYPKQIPEKVDFVEN